MDADNLADHHKTPACLPSSPLGSSISVTLHSSAAGASATRGGATKTDGAGVNPA
jgi:hypothetical protein